MKKIKNIAIELFDITDIKPSRSGGEHEISLDSVIDRSNFTDVLAVDFNNLAQYIDHTLLKADATKNDIIRIVKEANKYQFKSICINSSFIPFAKTILNKNILICTVVGFPLGASNSKTKLIETETALKDGANEIDMVINIGMIKSCEYGYVYQEIKSLASTCHNKGAILKVILETSLLTEKEKIIVSLLSKKAGADFVKTSTGFSTGGATKEDINLMRKVVGNKVGVKASGGVRDRGGVIKMLKAGANRIGASAGVSIVENFETMVENNSY